MQQLQKDRLRGAQYAAMLRATARLARQQDGPGKVCATCIPSARFDMTSSVIRIPAIRLPIRTAAAARPVPAEAAARAARVAAWARSLAARIAASRHHRLGGFETARSPLARELLDRAAG
jgi:hypothetical protein